MRTLIIGAGALGGLIGARLAATGARVFFAVRDRASAERVQQAGFRVSGVGGPVAVPASDVTALDEVPAGAELDLVVLATKAEEAMEIAPRAARWLAPGGTLLPIQNGAVSRLLADRLGAERVLGGLSNLGATLHGPGEIEQRNAGHLLIGELSGGISDRATRVRDWLGRGVEVRATGNLSGAIWSKLLLNCSVTTLGAIAGRTMRSYVATPTGRTVFDRAYDEALSVAIASGARPEKMMVDPVPPGWNGRAAPGPGHEEWLARVLDAYGDLKPSMLQDFERGRPTEIDFINGYVAELGRRLAVPTPVNAAIVETVHAIEQRRVTPDLVLLDPLARA
ncbi:MAG TPA: 2-dehydropantoate 2-reductase [Myxococcaceae bacterium]|jgi:2-dehydropantoate 2-reductase